MLLKFLIQEDEEEPKTLEFNGDYKIDDLENIYMDLIKTDIEWYHFKSIPNGFIIRKKNIKSVYLEGKNDESK